jgi:hypothetical protein
MTLSSTTVKDEFDGDASTTDFATTFVFWNSSELKVILTSSSGNDTTWTEGTEYDVTGGGGAVGTVSASTTGTDYTPDTGETLLIKSNVLDVQETALPAGGAFPSTSVEQELDRTVRRIQQQEEQFDRAALLTEASTYTGLTLDDPVANQFLQWNADGDGITSASTNSGQYLGSDGTVSLPFYSFADDPDTGFYRIGTGNVGYSANGSKLVDFLTTGLSVSGTLTASGVLSIDDTTDSTSGTTGSIHTDGGLGVAKDLFVATNAEVTGTTTFTGVTTHGGNVVSDTDSTDDLGTTGTRWANLWVDDITATTDVTVGNDLTVSNDLTVTGDLTVNGTTTTLNVTNVATQDVLLELNTGSTVANTNDLGLLMERGTTGDNVFLGWDESADAVVAGTTTATGTSTGNITFTVADFTAAVITGTTVEATGDTTAGDNAAMGYTAAEGLILTGQGSTYDFVLKNDADQDVARVATGTQVLDLPGSLKLASGATVTGIADEDDFSSDSATLLATQQSIGAYIGTQLKAPGLQMTWESTTTDTDQGAGKVWANNATLSSATVLYFDDVTNDSTSINSFIDSLDDPTATNSATIYIQEAGSGTAGVVFQVSGAVTSASTYSKVAVTHVATFGTLADADIIGVVFAFSGNNGAINNIVEDTTPQLGANLDTNDFMVEFDDAHGILDDSQNEHLLFQKTASAVNYFEMTNAATGNNVKFTANGSDTDVGIDYEAKGAGVHSFAGAAARGGDTALTCSTSDANIHIELADNNNFTHTFTQNATLANPTTAPVVGQAGSIKLTQASTAAYTLAFGSQWVSPGGTDPTVTAAAGAKDTIYYNVRSATEIEILDKLAFS